MAIVLVLVLLIPLLLFIGYIHGKVNAYMPGIGKTVALMGYILFLILGFKSSADNLQTWAEDAGPIPYIIGFLGISLIYWIGILVYKLLTWPLCLWNESSNPSGSKTTSSNFKESEEKRIQDGQDNMDPGLKDLLEQIEIRNEALKYANWKPAKD
jgi:hypothetical protein